MPNNTTITTDQLRSVLFSTENSNNENVLARFSWAGNANSSYSFGVLQFDVRTNHGNAPDLKSDNIASALAVQARADGLQRIDQIALGTDGSRLWAVQTPLGRNDHLFDIRASVATAAVNMSMDQSAAHWPQAMQKFQETQQAQNQTQDQQQAVQGQQPAR